jgi:hypothetical protein
MSKFDECKSVIGHYKDNRKCIELVTSLYVFSEAQSTGSPTHYDATTWQWGDKTILIQEVGIHPEIE